MKGALLFILFALSMLVIPMIVAGYPTHSQESLGRSFTSTVACANTANTAPNAAEEEIPSGAASTTCASVGRSRHLLGCAGGGGWLLDESTGKFIPFWCRIISWERGRRDAGILSQRGSRLRRWRLTPMPCTTTDSDGKPRPRAEGGRFQGRSFQHEGILPEETARAFTTRRTSIGKGPRCRRQCGPSGVGV